MSFKDINLKPAYRSRLDNVIRDFYTPVLEQSVIYKRAVGFFSSSALISLTAGICGLIKNGGTIQLVASPRLSPEDIEAINDGIRRRDDVITEVLLRELHAPKGKFEEDRLNLLSNLIAANRLEIKIAFLENENTVGMFHDKLGLMYDREGNIIAFSGSMNESAVAFKNNYESIDVFASWTQDVERVYDKQSTFNAIWSDYETGIKVMDFPEVKEEILKRYQINNTIDTKLDDDLSVGSSCLNTTMGINNITENETGPKIPLNVKLRQYQIDAINEWEKRNYIGIFDMATGTGKTYTGLAAIERLYRNKNKNLAVIIVCPYQHLVEQWKNDIIAFGMKPIVCYSASSQKNWKERLKTAVNSFNVGVEDHFCMVTTNASFSTDFVQNLIRRLSGNAVLVVDEAHNFGAENLSKSLPSNIQFRLALSATIDRNGDPEGTEKLYAYFGRDKCIEYTLEDAINNRMLTPYYYYPIVVNLNEEELDQYIELTTTIQRCVHRDSKGRIELSDYAKMLLIQRARIVAGASGKIDALKNIIAKKYINDNQMLIYCGATTIKDSDYTEGIPEKEEIRQIDLVTSILGNKLGMRVTQFTSAEKSEERKRIIDNFSEGKQLQALVAIRCLDEGVNIPSIKTAFILASSTNPKEYIQRRGRVLRLSSGKNHAVIYDFITLPISLNDVDRYDADTLNTVKSLAIREINRIKDFSSISINPYDSGSLVADIHRIYNIKNHEETEEEQNYV